MRKVHPRDEIPVKQFTEEAIKEKISRIKSFHTPKSVRARITKLFDWLDNLTGRPDIKPVLSRVYRDVDKYMEAVYPLMACRKGCAHCCQVAVQVTALEAHYLAQRAKVKVEDNVKERWDRGYPVDGYCPLLNKDTGLCSVYEYRPLACRVFASYDHYENCEDPNTSHLIHNSSTQPFLGRIQGWLVRNSAIAAQEHRTAVVADIRDWFSSK